MTIVAGKSWSPVRGKRMRLTRLNSTFAADTTAAAPNMGISSGFVSVKVTPQYDEGEKVQAKTAAGDLGINEPGQLVLQNAQVDVQFIGVDPDLFSLITGQQAVVDGAGAAVGNRLSGGVPITSGFALEVWAGVAGNSATVAGNGGTAWGYFLLPYLYGGKVSDFSIENGAASFTVSTETREGSGWGVGPYDVVDTSATGSPIVPGPLLTAIGGKDHVHMQYTTVAPPAAINGLAPVA